MTTRIGGIVVDIDARLAKLEKELARGTRELKRFEQNATASGNRVEAGLVGISKGVGTVVGVLGGLGIALGATQLVSFGRQALAMGDDLATAADQVGIGVERFQTLRQAFRELEVDGEMFDKAMMRLSTTLGDVQSGATDSATKALDRMGITARILSGEIDTTDELLDAIANSAKKFGTEAQYTSSIVDIFGRKMGVQLAAAMRDGGEAYRRGEADVRSFGTVLTEEQINKLADANEVIDKWQERGNYTIAIFAANAIQDLEAAGDAFDRFLVRMRAAEAESAKDDNWLTAGLRAYGKGRRNVKTPPNTVLMNPVNASDVTAMLGFNANPVAVPKPRPVARTGGAGGGGGGAPRRSGGGGGGAREIDSFARSIKELEKRLADARFEQTALIEQWDDATITDARMRMEALRYEQENGVKWTEEQRSKYRELADTLRTVEVQSAKSKVSISGLNDAIIGFDRGEFSSLDTLEASLERIAADIPDLRSRWDIALAGLDDAQGVAFDGLTRNLEGALLGFQSLEDAAVNFAKQLASMALQAFVFKPLAMALGIPGFASGTDFAPGGLALVGEKGPELVNLPRGSQVIPNNRLRTMNNPRVQSVGHGGSGAVVNQYFSIPGGVDLATRSEMLRLAEATKASTLSAFKESRRRSSN